MNPPPRPVDPIDRLADDGAPIVDPWPWWREHLVYRTGRPTILAIPGTQIRADLVAQQYAKGLSVEEIRLVFPQLSAADVAACIEWFEAGAQS